MQLHFILFRFFLLLFRNIEKGVIFYFASVKYTAVVDFMTGKINGTVFARNAYANYARSRSLPFNPQSSEQFNVRENFKQIVSSWHSLSDSAREGWNLLGRSVSFSNKLGDPKNYTGFNMYGKINMQLLNIGESALIDAPVKTEVDNIALRVDVVSSPSAMTAAFLPVIAAGQKLIILSTGPISAGVQNPALKDFKQIAVKDSTFLTGDSISSDYNKFFPYPVATGITVWFAYKMVDTTTGFASLVKMHKEVSHV